MRQCIKPVAVEMVLTPKRVTVLAERNVYMLRMRASLYILMYYLEIKVLFTHIYYDYEIKKLADKDQQTTFDTYFTILNFMS